LKTAFSARSGGEPSGGSSPSCRPTAIWSKITKFEAIFPSRNVNWSMPSSSIGLPVVSMPLNCAPV
jgi:hypothetical protein